MAEIVVIDGYTLNPGDNPWTPLEQLGTLNVYDRTEPESVVELAKTADILITNKCPISAEAIEQLPALKFIAVTATGFNIVDAAAARRRGIPVSNVPEYGTRTVAQFTWALILELCHRVGKHADSVAAGDWSKSPDFAYWLSPQVELDGKRPGLGWIWPHRAASRDDRARIRHADPGERPAGPPCPLERCGRMASDRRSFRTSRCRQLALPAGTRN